jgi:hypothetical protein
MDIGDIRELYFITEIANVASIMREGILSHNAARKVPHYSIAEHGVQERRKDKKIPGTSKRLHDYANLYFDAHNPMLSARRHMNDQICILCINKEVLFLDGVIITDQNASRDCWFKPAQEGLPLLKSEEVFAQFWIYREDPVEEYRLKGVKCAEVLVPNRVHRDYIFAAYVANNIALEAFRQESALRVDINGSLFF